MVGSRITAIVVTATLLFCPVAGIAGDLNVARTPAPYPPLVTDIRMQQKTIQHSTAPKGAAAGASGFPARPDGAVGAGAAVMTSIGVLGLLGLGISSVMSDSSSSGSGSSDSSGTSSSSTTTSTE